MIFTFGGQERWIALSFSRLKNNWLNVCPQHPALVSGRTLLRGDVELFESGEEIGKSLFINVECVLL